MVNYGATTNKYNIESQPVQLRLTYYSSYLLID